MMVMVMVMIIIMMINVCISNEDYVGVVEAVMRSSKFKERSHPVRLIHYKQNYFENGVSPTLPHTVKTTVISLGLLDGNFQDAKRLY
jgi:hypothetical protein